MPGGNGTSESTPESKGDEEAGITYQSRVTEDKVPADERFLSRALLLVSTVHLGEWACLI
jgi:hypothetical protein